MYDLKKYSDDAIMLAQNVIYDSQLQSDVEREAVERFSCGDGALYIDRDIENSVKNSS